MKIFEAITRVFESHGKYKAMNTLRALPDYVLVDIGISPELLSQGVRAWPWSVVEDNWVPKKTAFRRSIGTEVGEISVVDMPPTALNNNRTAA